MNKEDYEILINSLPERGGKPPEFAVKLLEDTCAATGLDWKRRHLYLGQRGGKWSVTLSIDGFRLIGSQDPDYAGQEGPFWCTSPNDTWTDIPPETRVYAAKVGIKRTNGTTTWGIAKFSDYKAGPMWDKFPSTMSAKCAEMLAWRKAFPGKLGGLYGVEEMAQAGASRGVPESTPSPGIGFYEKLIASAGDLDALKKVGKDISSDSLLTATETDALHKIYQARRTDLTAA